MRVIPQSNLGSSTNRGGLRRAVNEGKSASWRDEGSSAASCGS